MNIIYDRYMMRETTEKNNSESGYNTIFNIITVFTYTPHTVLTSTNNI